MTSAIIMQMSWWSALAVVFYGSQGYTHHGLEDLGVMRSMSNMTVIAPADPFETASNSTAYRPPPAYLRLESPVSQYLWMIQKTSLK